MALASLSGAFHNIINLCWHFFQNSSILDVYYEVVDFARNFEEHLKRTELVLQRLMDKGVNVNGSNFNFCQNRVSALEQIVTKRSTQHNIEQ